MRLTGTFHKISINLFFLMDVPGTYHKKNSEYGTVLMYVYLIEYITIIY